MGGIGKGTIITLVERSTRFVLLARLNTSTNGTCTPLQLATMIARLPLELRKSLTWDRRRETAQHGRGD